MKINLQINKIMIKMNKQRYFDVSFRYSRASWGVLGCPGVIRLTHSVYILKILTPYSGVATGTHVTAWVNAAVPRLFSQLFLDKKLSIYSTPRGMSCIGTYIW